MVRKLDERAFEEQVLGNAGREVVAFYGASMPGAAHVASDLEAAEKIVAGNADVFWVDTDDQTALAATYATGDITYILFEDGARMLDAHEQLSASQIVRMATDLEYGAD